jgi:hypothetical protein
MMELAVALARQCESEPGKVSPRVGAVVVRDGVVVDGAFRGELAPGEHAEYTLLEKKLADTTLAGATLFTTLEGWMESLAPEVEPFGIATITVSPGSFRTELLSNESTAYATPSIDDYAERGQQQREWWNARNGQQIGDPAKLAQALLTIAAFDQPPRRFIAGADAIAITERKIAELKQQIDAHRDLSSSLAIDVSHPAAAGFEEAPTS